MRVYHLVICSVLFTTAVCFNTLNAITDLTKSSPPLDSSNQNCNCENGDCVTNKQGHSKCVCRHGFSLQGEFTCKPCDCGSLGKCIFILTPDENDQFRYEKKCVCDTGRAEKDGVCVDCFCGNNSACDFDNGERRCYCIDGFSEKDGVCTKCDCGFNGKCEYENGNKKCECDEGYLELNGMCEECDCGDNGTCSFVNGQRTCECESGFSVKDGKCEACDCGSNSENCVFVDGVKQCKCNDRYSDRYGTCEECYCGDRTQSCNFNENQKTCSCSEGYVQKGEMCELGCSAENPCQNGGYCKEGFCFCLNGTRGEFCDVIDECSNLCPNQSDVECAYDTTSQKAFCRCLDNNLSYDPNIKQCRKGCSKDDECLNGGKCGSKGTNKFCNCLPGTKGDRCEIIDDCTSGRVWCPKSITNCIFDVKTRKAICKCKNSNDEYDSQITQCIYHCKKNSDCLNGAKCVNGRCKCLFRTHGARCEIVDDCFYGLIRCRGSSASCVYEAKLRRGTCKCNNRNEFYNFWFGRCMRKCPFKRCYV